jgi:hypothetical protein
MEMIQHPRRRFPGLDIHRPTIAVTVAVETGVPASYGTIAHDSAAARKLIVRLSGPDV